MYLETALQMPVEADSQIIVIGTSKKKRSHFTPKIWEINNAFGDLFFFLLVTKNRLNKSNMKFFLILFAVLKRHFS